MTPDTRWSGGLLLAIRIDKGRVTSKGVDSLYFPRSKNYILYLPLESFGENMEVRSHSGKYSPFRTKKSLYLRKVSIGDADHRVRCNARV